MSLSTRLSGVVNLKPGERKSFRYLFFLSLTTGIGLSFFFVGVNTFLIQKTSVSNLPYAYIISGLGGVLLIKLYQFRQQKAGIIRSYSESVLAFLAITVLVFFAYRKFGDQPAYAVYLAYSGFLFFVPFSIIFALGFSAVCARLYNLSQSKRLLALVGTGEIIASIIGYLSSPLISKLSGSADYLLVISAVCILPALVPIQLLMTDNREKLSHLPVAKAALKKLNLSFFTSEKFYLLIAGVSVFSVAAMYFVDYSYLLTVRFTASYTGLEIAVIVGLFFSIVKTGELIFSFLSGHILSSKGVKFSILLLPLLLSGCFIFAAIGGFAFGTNPVFILSFVFLAKFAERVVRKGISTPATKVLYQVTGSERLRIEATIEGVLNQVAAVVSGGILLIFSASFKKADPLFFLSIIAVLCFVLFLVWSFISLKLYEQYRKKIWSYLTERRSAGDKQKTAAGQTAQQESWLSEQPIFGNAFAKAQKTVAGTKNRQDLHPLELYSPSAFNTMTADDPAQLRRKLISTYYTNTNFFYRLAVIRYFQSGKEPFSIRLFKEFWEISDLLLKLELIMAFNLSGERPDPTDSFYFENLCQQYSNELIYTLSAQNDLRDVDDLQLQAALKWHCDKIIQLLFELLKVQYEPSAIQVIYDIIIADDHQDMESKLFALELLDNTLNDELKSRLIPIFEPVDFDQKIGKLQQFVPVSALSAERQLKELLMKDFTLVNAYLKEACLVSYFALTGDVNVIKAFHTSAIQNLQHRADHLLHSDENYIAPTRDVLKGELEKMYTLNPVQVNYLYNQGIALPGGRKDRVAITSSYRSQAENPYTALITGTGGNVLLDTYALALLVDGNGLGFTQTILP